MYIHYSINSTDLYVRDDCLCSFQNRHFKIVICVDRRKIKRIKFDNTVNKFGNRPFNFLISTLNAVIDTLVQNDFIIICYTFNILINYELWIRDQIIWILLYNCGSVGIAVYFAKSNNTLWFASMITAWVCIKFIWAIRLLICTEDDGYEVFENEWNKKNVFINGSAYFKSTLQNIYCFSYRDVYIYNSY